MYVRAVFKKRGAIREVLRVGAPVWAHSDDPSELARRHRELGYRAAFCPTLMSGDTEGARAVRTAFEASDVVIAEVGAWVNLLDPDGAKRKANLSYVTDQLATAEEVGALCCVTIVGSYSSDSWHGPHAKNMTQECFDAAVENARTIIDAVAPHRAKFTYEMMPYTIPDSVDSFAELVRAVDRDGFGVHLDPVNIISSPQRYYGNAAVLMEAFRKLGPWIVSCHGKDTLIKSDLTIRIDEARPGLGYLAYNTFLAEIAKLPQSPPLMLEHLETEEEYTLARDFVFGVAHELGIEV